MQYKPIIDRVFYVMYAIMYNGLEIFPELANVQL